jgi:hypothetical protein
MGTSVAQLLSEVKSELGDGYVNVELTDAAFNHVLTIAKRWFSAKKGYVIYRPIIVVDQQLSYQMKSDCQQVLDVIFSVPSDVAAFFTMGFFDIIPYGPNALMNSGSGVNSYSGFAQLLQFTEQRKRIFSVEPGWDYEPQTQILHITARGSSPFGIMMVQMKTNNFDTSTLIGKDDYMFVRYVKAKCKETIGRIRSKYDALPASGGPVSMDGKDLIAESVEDIKALDLEIFQSQGPDLIVIG